ncbi:transposase [Desulfosarcina sp.]|nr:transposase [Desulfosarcina sp.]
MEEKELKKINTRAENICKAMEKPVKLPEGDRAIFNEMEPVLNVYRQSADAPIKFRKQLDKSIKDLAVQLPVWQVMKDIRGIGPLALGIIIGETGNLSNYSTPAKVWKRMGVGLVVNKTGKWERQRKFADKDMAISAGYNPSRRSTLFNVGDTLIKGNRDGEYRTLYLARKELEAEKNPEATKMANHRRAQRYMEKRWLKHLWKAWNPGFVKTDEELERLRYAA